MTCLVVAGEDVGGLGHEVHAAEHDELGVVLVGRDTRQAEAVAPGVGPAHHFFALVVVAEDEQPFAEGRLGGGESALRVPRAWRPRRSRRVGFGVAPFVTTVEDARLFLRTGLSHR